MLCHGNGNVATDGCCYVAGKVCPLRWLIDGGHVWDHLGTDLGTVEEFIAAYSTSTTVQQAVRDQIQGVRIVCRAAVDVLVNDPKLLANRTRFESAWKAHVDYVALVRPHWEQVEQRLGLAAGSYNCPTWKGTGAAQCCFAEDQATNDAGAAGLSANAVKIRQAGGT
jgi:hypothetical protein